MKVKIEWEIDVPDEYVIDDNIPISEDKFLIGHLIQAVYDEVINYCYAKHLEDELYWLTRQPAENTLSTELMIKYHKKWANAIRSSKYSIERA